jgi:hypothetical protein
LMTGSQPLSSTRAGAGGASVLLGFTVAVLIQ